MLWNPVEHTDQENLRFCLLRAMEWSSFPSFLSQAYGPLLFPFIPFWTFFLLLFLVNIFWRIFIRYKVVSVDLAFMGNFISRLKWITAPTMGIYFYIHDNIPLALASLFWPFIAIFLSG